MNKIPDWMLNDIQNAPYALFTVDSDEVESELSDCIDEIEQIENELKANNG